MDAFTRRVFGLARVAAFALLLLLPGKADAAPWYEHYALAEDAMKAENWSEAVVQLNEAIQRRGDSGAHIRSYGMKVISYFPYLKLGIAYHNLGQYDAAIQALETEERLGAIQESPADLQTLRSIRQAANDARSNEADRLASERDRIVTAGLAESEALQKKGKIDEALLEVARVLAVAPDNSEAAALQTRLRDAVAKRDLAERERAQLNALVDNGRTALEAGNYDVAMSFLSQADRRARENPELVRPPDLSELLATARGALERELGKEAEADTKKTLASLLDEADRLEQVGEIDAALAKIQRALALDPSNARAHETQTRLLDRGERAALDKEVESLTTEMNQAFSAGRLEESLSAANRILALDSGNSAALQLAGRAYVALGRKLLGAGTSGNLPPAIRFTDLRETTDDGRPIQLVEDASFRLNGFAIDNAEPTLTFTDADGRPLHGTIRSQIIGDYHIAEFAVALPLTPGTTAIRVSAVDPEGLAASSEYLVRYLPPLIDRTWFRALMGLLIVAALVTPLAVIRVQRNKKRTRRFNPYIAGAPVLSEDLFFGREQLVQRILQTIHNNSLLLHGERRIGKTSLQHHLRKRLLALDDPSYRFFPVFVDLQGVPEERFFATLMEEIQEQLREQMGGAFLTDAEVSRDAYGYREFVADLRTTLSALRASTTKQVKLVLLIDEVDELNDYDPRVNQRLRSLFMKSFAENLVAIVSGVQIRKDWAREASPWYNFFEEIEVTPLSRGDVEALVMTPIAGVLKVEDGLVDRIVGMTGGRPYLVQRLCISLVNHAYDRGRRVITLADIDAVGLPEVS